MMHAVMLAAATATLCAPMESAHPTSPTETHWLVKTHSIQWPRGIDETQLLDFLDRIGIVLRRISPQEWEGTVATHERASFVPPANHSAHSQEIWRGRTVTLVVSGDGRLRLMPLRPVTVLADLSPDEMIEMEETALKMGALFSETMKTGDYYRWIPLGKEAGQVGDQLYMEVIPGCAFDGAELDVAEKLRVDLYTMLNDKTTCLGLLKDQVEAIKAVAPRILSQVKTPDYNREFNPIKGWTNIATAARLAANALLQRLYQRRDPVIPVTSVVSRQKRQKTEQALPDRMPLPFAPARDHCPFCNPAIVQKQLVHAGKTMNVLSNHRPYMDCHLMTTSNEHIGNGSSSAEQILEKYRLWTRIDAIFRNLYKKPASAIITRCGRGAGQTVAHHHDHILGIDPQELPLYFAHALNEVMGQPIPALSEDEMTAIRDKISPLFKRVSMVIFDFGGVVNLSDGADDIAFIAKAFGLQLPLDQVKELFWTEVKPLNIGQIDEKAFWTRFATATGGQVPENWEQRWKDHYLAHHAAPNERVVALVKRLKQAGYLTPLLSDTIPSHAECNRHLYTHFDPLVLSTQAGFKKPDARIYQHLLDRVACEPSECVFIDDLEKNVKGAQEVGMHGIQFASYEALVQELKRLAIRV
jgi:epoxide hydrolase-like predicted phosphatase